MKEKTTRKYLLQNFGNIIAIGYCNIQSLLACLSPAYYLTRAEGWAADVYIINDNTAIVTGYAPVGNIEPAYDLQRKYEEMARAILAEYTEHLDYNIYSDKLNDLLNDFVLECLIFNELTKKEYETIKNNFNSFKNNFGLPRFVRADYGRGLYVFYPANSDSYIHYCENINYLDGWLYGVVQGFHCEVFNRGYK